MDKKKYTPGITQRFLLICDEVIHEGQAKNRSAFAKSVGEHQQNLSMMEKGTRAPTLEQIAIACKIYGYSANWVMLNIGEKKLKVKEQQSTEERLSNLEAEVSRISRTLKRRKDLMAV